MNERTPKRWLAASLMLNLFLVAGIGSAAWRWHAATTGAAAGGPQQRGLRFVADDLPQEARKAFRQGLRRARHDASQAQQDGKSARQDIVRLLAADQFDGPALAAALERARDADMAARARMEASVVDFAATLAPAERRKLVDSLQRHTNLAGPAAPPQKPAEK